MESPSRPKKSKAVIHRTPGRQRVVPATQVNPETFKSRKRLAFGEPNENEPAEQFQKEEEQKEEENISINEWIDRILNKVKNENITIQQLQKDFEKYKTLYQPYIYIMQEFFSDIFNEMFLQEEVQSQLQANKMEMVMNNLNSDISKKQTEIKEKKQKFIRSDISDYYFKIGPKNDPEKYGAIEIIGKGKFGITFKAKNINRNKEEQDLYAIKIFYFNPELEISPRENWEKETQCLLDVLDICKEGGILCYKDSFIKKEGDNEIFVIVTPYLDGYKTLFEYLQNIESLSESDAKNIYTQVVETKNKLADICIHHSDLNLYNIMYHPKTKDIKIIDLGLCGTPEEEIKYWGKNYGIYSDEAQLYSLSSYLFFKVKQRKPMSNEEIKMIFSDKIKSGKVGCKRVSKKS